VALRGGRLFKIAHFKKRTVAKELTNNNNEERRASYSISGGTFGRSEIGASLTTSSIMNSK
jgi:hypothetical protein